MLYDIFKVRWGSNIYIISDTHFSDEQSYRLRFPEKFIGIEENSEESLKIVSELDLWQVKLINKTCGKASTLIHLGDVGNIFYVKLLKPRYKILLCGNHDKGASNYKRVKKEFYCEEIPLSREEWFKKYGNSYSCYTLIRHFGCYENIPESFLYESKLHKAEDNHLFDEVYEGPLMVNDRLILSHEPIRSTGDYFFNIHGHVHSKNYKGDTTCMNVCAEAIDYKPINLLSLLRKGLLKNIDNIHRKTIDFATFRKNSKNG